MAYAFDDVNVGGQLQVGAGVCGAIGVGDEKINGSAHVEGPMVVGPPGSIAYPLGTLNVAWPNTNDDPDNKPGSHALYVQGGSPNAIMVVGDMYVTGQVDCLWKGRLAARFSAADAKPKLFDIPHPSKGEGHRLSYACIEGPEVGVYYRGRLRNQKEIQLPAYWKDLVHTDSISVQLQPIGAHQDIIVKRWDDSKIYLQSKAGFPIDCFYHIYGERKDVNGLVVEYEGESWEDHPQRTTDKDGSPEWKVDPNSNLHNTYTQ